MKTDLLDINYILRQLNIEKLSPMQEASLEAGKHKEDIVLLSPTGSGKTLAFLLPLIKNINQENKETQVLIIVPSRELALQIESVFKSMKTGIQIVSCYGGHSVSEEKNFILNHHPAVIVGTPGRVTDHLHRGNINADTIRTLVLDEFDKSLEFGFFEEMEEIISQLSHLQRRVLVSATDSEEIPQFVGVENVIRLDFLEKEEGESRLSLKKVISPDKDKLETLYNLLCELGSKSTIVFCNYREGVERVGAYLRSRKFYNEIFHGGMEQVDREKAIYKFRNGSCHVLISTDLGSRGLDIPEVEFIVHYHLPVNEEAYTHRNGRTARWNASGISYLLVHEEEKLPAYLPEELEIMKLSETPNKPSSPLWATLYIGKGKKDKLGKGDIVGFLIKKGNLQKEDIGQIDVKDKYAFVAIKRKKLQQTLTLLSGEKVKNMKTIIEEAK